MADIVFVQPHYDDIALSCGGTVAQLAEDSSPLIVTICGGSPRAELSSFARMQHERWNIDDAGIVMERRREDQCAAKALGEPVRTLSLDIPDAIYRDSAYSSEEALFGDLQQDDWALVDDLAASLADLGDTFVMPLAVGNHVDHQLACMAGLELQRGGRTVWFYGDLPYALREGALDDRLANLAVVDTCARLQTPDSLERRWAAVECYRSQVPVLFRSIEHPRASFELFGHTPGGSAERFWRVESRRSGE